MKTIDSFFPQNVKKILHVIKEARDIAFSSILFSFFPIFCHDIPRFLTVNYILIPVALKMSKKCV